MTTTLDRPMVVEPMIGPKTRGQVWADMIRTEGRLGKQKLVDANGLRCAGGVIGDCHLGDDSEVQHRASWGAIRIFAHTYHDYWGSWVPTDNNGFVGTPEARADFMAARVAVLI